MVDYPDYNDESIGAWEANAEFWDEVQGDEGNYWQRTLVFPETLDLLQPLPTTLLEIACGNGNFARQVASLGVAVTATDGSQRLLDIAGQRSAARKLDWMRLDATDRTALAAMAGARGAPFGAAVCNMAIMDIAEITPLFDMLPLSLAENAPFVFSVLHPAFNLGPDVRLFVERFETPDGRLVTESGVRITGYLDTGVQHGIASVGQPSQQPYFHRSLTELLTTAFDRGWVLDGIREPSFRDRRDPDSENRLTWDDVPDIPPVLLARLRHRG
ncbi:MAG: methyltransferase domain-containing protein [Chloroflexota bacterium]|nr:methyltransferase domain-containing protein [Chloroflexota bacterium]